MSSFSPAPRRAWKGRALLPGGTAKVRLTYGVLGPRTLTVTAADLAEHFEQLAAQWPLGMEVRFPTRQLDEDGAVAHLLGRVYLDSPERIPGVHLGQASAYCLRPDGEWICLAVYDGLFTRPVWRPVAQLRHPRGRKAAVR